MYWFIFKPAFGIASFIATWIYRSQLAVQGNWTGITTGLPSAEVFYEEIKDKDRTKRIRIGLRGIPKNRFTLKREGAVDKLSKWMLFSTEPQVQDEKFDDKVYIASDNVRLVRLLQQDKKARDLIHNILYILNRGIKKSIFIQNSPHRFWVEYKTESDLGGQSPRELAKKIAPLLQALRAQLVADLESSESHWDIKNAVISNVLSLIPNVLFVSAVIYFIEVSFTRNQESDYFYPLVPGFIAATIACIIFTGICKLLLSDSSRAHMPVVEFLLLGFASIVLITFSGYHSANQDLDVAQPRTHNSMVVAKQRVKRRRSTSYYFHVESSMGGDFSSERRIKISSGMYNQVDVGEKIDIAIKPGYLGHEWVEGVSKSWE